jgi:hypothetical protein
MSEAQTGKARALPYLLVSLGALLLFGPMLLSGRVLFWGTPLLQFVPWREFALETLLQGHLPLWNPELGMGAPLLANYQSALLYPPNWILGLTGIAWGQGLLVMLHLIWAGSGMALLARRLGSSLLGQSLAGLAFGLSGYLVARAGFLSINAAAAWLPWLVLCADKVATGVAERDSWRTIGKGATWLALAFAMQWLAGHAQTAWYSLILVGLWALWRAAKAGGRRGALRVVPWMLAVGALAFALAAVQLVPTLEYMAQSHRAETLDPEFAMTYSFAPWRTLGLLLPDLFGNPARGDYWGYGNYWEDAIYIGVIPFLFALLALVRGIAGREARKGLIRFMAVLSTIAFLLALGKNTPVFPWLFEHIPTFNIFQAPARWNLIPVFCLALLAAFGADAWRAPEGRTLYWMRLSTAGAVMIVVVAWLVGALAPIIEPTFSRSFWLAGVWILAFCVLALRRPAKLTLAWIAVLGLIVLLDLGYSNSGLNPSAPGSLYEGRSELAEQVAADQRIYMPAEVEHDLIYERTHRFDTFESQIDLSLVRETGLPNTSMLDGIASANNFDPLLPGRFVVWLQALEDLPLEHQESLLGLMNVGWRAKADAASQTGLRYVSVSEPARVRLVYEAVWEDAPGEALERVLDPSFDPSQMVVLEGSEESDIVAAGEGRILRFEQVHPGRIEIEVRTSQDAWLVLSDAGYPGWQAAVDEIDSEILHADYLFRAVRVPAGEHSITFTYESLAVRLGAWMSVLGLMTLGSLVWLWRRD